MSSVIEEMRKEAMVEVAKKMIADGNVTLEKIAEYLSLSLDEVKRLKDSTNL